MESKWKSWILGLMKKKRILIPLVFVLLYNLIFNRVSGQFLFEKISPSLLSDKVVLIADIQEFSLLYGISMDNIRLGWKDSSKSPIFQCEKFSILWDVPSLFLGRIRIRSIALLSPKIHLIIESGIANWTEILPTSKNNEEDSKESENANESLESIHTFIPISVFTSLEIRNLKLEYIDNDNGFRFSTHNWNLEYLMDTYRFRSIPLSINVLELFETLELRLNPKDKVLLSYSDSTVESANELEVMLEIVKRYSGKEIEFYTRSKVGGDSIGFKPIRQMPVQFSLGLSWDYSWIPSLNTFKLSNLDLEFQKKKWIEASGSIEKQTSDNWHSNFYLHQSEIQLQDLNSIFQKIPGLGFRMGGLLSLSPLSIHGDSSNIKLDWKIIGRNIGYFPNKGTSHNLNYIELDLNSELDLVSTSIPTPSNPLPIVKSLELKKVHADYNGLIAKLNGNYISEKNLELNLDLKRFKIEQFIENATGFVDGELIVSGVNLAKLNIDGELNLSKFRFIMDRSISGYSNNKANFGMSIGLGEEFSPQYILLDRFELKSFNQRGGLALLSKARLGVDMDKLRSLTLSQLMLSFNLTNAMSILPLPLKQSLLKLESLTPELELSLIGNIGLDARDYKISFQGKIPGLDLKDLQGSVSIQESKTNKGDWILNDLRMSGFSEVMKIQSDGKLIKKSLTSNPLFGGYSVFLNLNASLKSDSMIQLTRNFNYRGNFQFQSRIVDNLIEGDLVLENIRTLIQSGDCPGDSCKLFLVENLNADIPISHNLIKAKSNSLIEGDNSRFVKTYGRIPRDNFSIQQIIGTHPSIQGAPFVYVKGAGNYPGLTGRIRYKENYLHIDGLKASLLDGTIYGKDLLLNVGVGDPKDMEFMGSIQVRDIDLKQLLSSSAQKLVDDGKIKADLNISGINILDPIPKLTLYFSIFQIGRDFGKSVMNILSTKGALMNFITDSYAIDKVQVELSKGLVYADVLFKKSILSMVVQLQDSKITQSRMPLANFLQRAENEIASYK